MTGSPCTTEQLARLGSDRHPHECRCRGSLQSHVARQRTRTRKHIKTHLDSLCFKPLAIQKRQNSIRLKRLQQASSSESSTSKCLLTGADKTKASPRCQSCSIEC